MTKLKGLDLSTPEKVSTFRARDVRQLLQGTNTDPKVMKCLEALAESNVDLLKQNQAMAQAINQCIDICASFSIVAERMKETVDSMKMEGPVV